MNYVRAFPHNVTLRFPKLVLRPQLLQVKATVSKEYCCRTVAEKDVGSGSKTRLQNQLSTPFEAHAVWE